MRLLVLLLMLAVRPAWADVIGMENHNPTNIRSHSIKPWKKLGAVGLDPWGHLVFSNDEQGLRCARYVLEAYSRKHHLKRLDAIVWRWVGPPRSEAQRIQKEGYLRCIVQHTGIPADGIVNLQDRHEMARLCRALVIGEVGRDPFPRKLYLSAFDIRSM